MTRTSTQGYVTITIQGYENSPCIPTGRTEEDRAELICFMQPIDKRLVWIQRNEISIGELTQPTLI